VAYYIAYKNNFFKYGGVLMGFYILHGLQGLMDSLPLTPPIILLNQRSVVLWVMEVLLHLGWKPQEVWLQAAQIDSK